MERRTCLLGGQLLQRSAKRLSYWPTASGTLQQSLYTARAAACISLPSVPSSFLTDKLGGGGWEGREEESGTLICHQVSQWNICNCYAAAVQ